MTRSFALVLVAGAVLCCTPRGQAETFGGPFGKELPLSPGEPLTLDKDYRVPQVDTQLGERVKFKAGRRACVIVMGDHKPIVPVTIEVLDDKGNVVARDNPAKGAESRDAKGNDVAAVIWYPPRDAYYTIKVTNHGEASKACWVAIN
jgi:hypothetical protein